MTRQSRTRANIRYHYRMLRRACLVLCVLMGTAMPVSGAPRSQPSEADLKRLQDKIQVLNQRIAEEAGSRDALRVEIERMERQINVSAEQIRLARSDVERQERRIRETQAEQQQAAADLQRQKAALAQQLRSAYLIGEGGQLRLLLSQTDMHRLDRVNTYYQYLNRARARFIEDIQKKLDEMTALQDRLAQEKIGLESLQKQYEEARLGLDGTRQQRRDALRKIEKRLRDDQSEMRALQNNERQMQRLLSELRDTLRQIPQEFDRGNKPFSGRRGKLPWPVQGKLLAAYGQSKAGSRIAWNGHWIAAAEGAPVRAVANGRVAYVGWLHRYGLIVILDHGDGYFTLYGHNSRVLRTGGETVKAGDSIAQAGTTGGYDRSGVYFEIRKGTEPLNPKAWLGK